MANGNFGGGNGTDTSPYIVEDAQDLNAVRNNLGAHYIQSKNIDLSSFGNWQPIGSYDSPFTGFYDGKGFLVSNMKINTTASDVGFFGAISSGKTAKGLCIVNCDIKTTGSNVGAVVGRVRSGGLNSPHFTDCYSSGRVVGGDSVGGFVGFIIDYGFAKNCYSSCSVVGTSSVGGFCGSFSSNYHNRGYFTSCYSSGDVSGTDNVGGFFGKTNANPVNCYSLVSYVRRIGTGSSSSFGKFAGSGNEERYTRCFTLDSTEFRG